jgi:hypothetical protein
MQSRFPHQARRVLRITDHQSILRLEHNQVFVGAKHGGPKLELALLLRRKILNALAHGLEQLLVELIFRRVRLVKDTEQRSVGSVELNLSQPGQSRSKKASFEVFRHPSLVLKLLTYSVSTAMIPREFKLFTVVGL